MLKHKYYIEYFLTCEREKREKEKREGRGGKRDR